MAVVPRGAQGGVQGCGRGAGRHPDTAFWDVRRARVPCGGPQLARRGLGVRDEHEAALSVLPLFHGDSGGEKKR